MNGSTSRAETRMMGIAVAIAVIAATAGLESRPAGIQGGKATKPPVPYEDVGACPFEGCVYREWLANERVVIRSRRHADAPVVFTVEKGDQVRALTGVVVTVRAGRVEFRVPVDLASDAGMLHIEPGQTLFLLTYRGEGFTKAWFNDRVWDNVDGAMAFFNGLCESDPSRCTGKIVERPDSVWWVQIRSARGQVGWTKEVGKFDGKGAFGN
jgi:hypothetical protein